MAQRYHIRPREVAFEAISAYLVQQKLSSGDRLPAEREMCEMWDLNRSTLRSAIAQLERDGLLEIRPGSGIFVAGPKFNRNLQDLKSLTETAQEQGMTLESRVLSLGRIECDKQFSRLFRVVLGTPLWQLTRLRCVDGTPIMIETSCFLVDRYPDIDRFDLARESLFDLFVRHYGSKPVEGEEKISITRATEREAQLLGIEPDGPLFRSVSQSRDQDGTLLEYCRAVARADKLVMTSILERRESE